MVNHKGVDIVTVVNETNIDIFYPLDPGQQQNSPGASFSIETTLTSIEGYTVSSDDNRVQIKAFGAMEESTMEFTLNSLATVSKVAAANTPSYVKSKTNTGTLKRFNFWSDISLGGNNYKLYFNSLGYYLLDSDRNIVGKFYSDKSPKINSDGVEFLAEPVQISANEVALPFLISNLQEEPTYGVNVLKIKLDEEVFQGSFSENFLEYFMGGLILKYFDGKTFTEYGFCEEPDLEVQTGEENVPSILSTNVASRFIAGETSQEFETNLSQLNFGNSGLLRDLNLTNDVKVTDLNVDRGERKLSVTYKRESAAPEAGFATALGYRRVGGAFLNIDLTVAARKRLISGLVQVTGFQASVPATPGRARSLSFETGTISTGISSSGVRTQGQNLITRFEFKVTGKQIASNKVLSSLTFDTNLVNLDLFSKDVFLTFAESLNNLYTGDVLTYNLNGAFRLEPGSESSVPPRSALVSKAPAFFDKDPVNPNLRRERLDIEFYVFPLTEEQYSGRIIPAVGLDYGIRDNSDDFARITIDLYIPRVAANAIGSGLNLRQEVIDRIRTHTTGTSVYINGIRVPNAFRFINRPLGLTLDIVDDYYGLSVRIDTRTGQGAPSFAREIGDDIDRTRMYDIDVRDDMGRSIYDYRAPTLQFTGGLAPVVDNIQTPVAANLNNLILSSGYTLTPAREAVPERSSVGSNASATNLTEKTGQAGVNYSLTSYNYSPSDQTIKVVLNATSGNLAAASISKFKILNSSGIPIVSLDGADAVFNATDGSYTWSNIATDPITQSGMFYFLFTNGAGSENATFSRTVDASEKEVTYDIYNLQETDATNIPPYAELSGLRSVIGITMAERWEALVAAIANREFSFRGTTYNITKFESDFANRQIKITFSQDLSEDDDVEDLKFIVEAMDDSAVTYSFVSKTTNVLTLGNPTDSDGNPTNTNVNLPPGFVTSENETFILKVRPESVAENANLETKTYSYIAVYEWTDNKGLKHFSERTLTETIQHKGGIGAADTVNPVITIKNLNLTEKENVSVSLFRTLENGSTYRKVTSVNNLKNSESTAIEDSVVDANLKEPLLFANDLKYQPPSGPITVVFQNRLYMAGFKEFTNRVVASDERNINANALTFDKTFNDSLNIYFDYPIVGMAVLDANLIIFTEQGTFSYSGQGAPQKITSMEKFDLESFKSLASFSSGILFKSSHGIHELKRGTGVEFIGIDVIKVNDKKVVESAVSEGAHEIVYVFDDGSTLVYNYYYKQWSEGISPVKTIYYEQDKDKNFIIDNSKRLWESDPDSTDLVTMEMETGFFNLEGNAQGYIRVDECYLLGDFGNYERIRILVAYDWSEAYEDEHIFEKPSIKRSFTPEGQDFAGNRPYGQKPETQNQIAFAVKKSKSSVIKLKIIIESNKVHISNVAFIVKVSGELSKIQPTQRG